MRQNLLPHHYRMTVGNPHPSKGDLSWKHKENHQVGSLMTMVQNLALEIFNELAGLRAFKIKIKTKAWSVEDHGT